MDLEKEAKRIIEVLDYNFKDNNFKYYDESHTYFYEKKKLTPTTKFIEQFKVPFDKDRIAARVAERQNVSKEEILEQWKTTALEGTTRGSISHNYIENKIKKIEQANIDDPEIIQRMMNFEKFYNARLAKLIPVVQEYRVFNVEWGIAGTIDALYLTEKGQLIMLDWKTNKKYSTLNDTIYKNLLGPFSSYGECSNTLYSLQLSVYKAILKNIGLDLYGMYIVHIPKLPEQPKVYTLMDFSDIIRFHCETSNS